MMRSLLKREILGLWRHREAMALSGLVLLMACAVFVFVIGDREALLAQVGAGVFWALMVLLTLMQAQSLFERDTQEGVLDYLQTLAHPLSLYLAIRCLGVWCAYGVPLLIALPLMMMMFYMPLDQVFMLSAKFALGTFHLSLVAVFAGALTQGAGRYRSLGFFLAFPLFLPVLICITIPVDVMVSIALSGAGLLVSLPACLILGAKALQGHLLR